MLNNPISDIALNVLSADKTAVSVDLADLRCLKKKGMIFTMSAWDIGDIRLSSINLNAMFGLMKMESAIVTSRDHDVPLFNADFVCVPKKKTLLVEMYDTCLGYDMKSWIEKGNAVKAEYDHFKDYPRQARWYDSQLLELSLAKRDASLDQSKIDEIVKKYFLFYKEWYQNSPECKRSEKIAKTAEYVNNLLKQGGSSTDQFRSLFGETITEKLFMTLFGIK